MFEELYQIWSQLGVGFVVKPNKFKTVDLEKTIIATAQAGREDSRLLFGMRAWLLKHHDLVNGSRLIRFLKSERDTAVLGAILDSVLQQESRSTLSYVIKHCKKAKVREFVFKRIANSKVQSHLNQEENLPIWEKWNLISREMGEMEGVVLAKSYVLKHNRNLALRLLFGPCCKADLLAFLLEHKSGNAHHIAQMLGLSYEPVYTDLVVFKEMGMIEDKIEGRARVFKIRTLAQQRLNAFLQSSVGALQASTL